VLVADNWYVGNARTDGRNRRGWLIGHFLGEEDGIRLSKDVEIKWGIHLAGEQRKSWQDAENRTTVIVLIEGYFRINLSVDSFVLREQGDYAMWGPGIGHSWQAEEDSIVLTIRWPSI
jgi:hypothetical protein